MDKIDFTQEQRKDFGKSLLERIKECFSKIFHADKPLHGKELNEYLLSQTESDEERETLQEMFEENETFHDRLKELKESGKNVDDWYEDEIVDIVKRLDPEATRADIDSVKEAVAKQIDNDAEDAINALENLNDSIISQEDGKEEML